MPYILYEITTEKAVGKTKNSWTLETPPGFVLVPCAKDTDAGDSMYCKNAYAEYIETGEWPLTGDVDSVRDEKLDEIILKYTQAYAPINEVYPPSERESWTKQLAEAELLVAYFEELAALEEGEEPPEFPNVVMVPIQFAMRNLPDETLYSFCMTILQNNDLYSRIAGYLNGRQQHMYNTVKAMDDEREIRNYPVEYTLPEGIGYAGL